jgi:hypothetical protein
VKTMWPGTRLYLDDLHSTEHREREGNWLYIPIHNTHSISSSNHVRVCFRPCSDFHHEVTETVVVSEHIGLGELVLEQYERTCPFCGSSLLEKLSCLTGIPKAEANWQCVGHHSVDLSPCLVLTSTAWPWRLGGNCAALSYNTNRCC